MKTDVQHPIYLKDYAPPPFLIGEAVLDLALAPAFACLRWRSKLRRTKNSGMNKSPAPAAISAISSFSAYASSLFAGSR